MKRKRNPTRRVSVPKPGGKYWLKYSGGREGLEYGLDYVTPVPWRIVSAAKEPRSRYVWLLPESLTKTAAFYAYFLQHRGRDIHASMNQMKRTLGAMRAE